MTKPSAGPPPRGPHPHPGAFGSPNGGYGSPSGWGSSQGGGVYSPPGGFVPPQGPGRDPALGAGAGRRSAAGPTAGAGAGCRTGSGAGAGAGRAPRAAGADSLNEKLSRIARYDGGDAAARFAEEKQKAQSGGFLGKDVQAGDEAFCTTPDDASAAAGALVRRGDTLVYVGTTAAGADAAAGCDLALKLVEKVR